MIKLIVILLGVFVLTVYAMIEKRLNQRACLSCAYRVSADAVSETCPRCGASVNWPELNQPAKAITA